MLDQTPRIVHWVLGKTSHLYGVFKCIKPVLNQYNEIRFIFSKILIRSACS